MTIPAPSGEDFKDLRDRVSVLESALGTLRYTMSLVVGKLETMGAEQHESAKKLDRVLALLEQKPGAVR